MTAIDTRNIKRDSLFQLAQVRLYGSANSDRVKVRNLSDTGMMVQGELLVEEGQRVIVTLRNIGEVGGKVVWVNSAKCGIAFDETIDADLARKDLSERQTEAPRYARPAVEAPKDFSFARRRL